MRFVIALFLLTFASAVFSTPTPNPDEIYLKCVGSAGSNDIKGNKTVSKELGKRFHELKINSKSIYEMGYDGKYIDYAKPLPNEGIPSHVRDHKYTLGPRFIKLSTTIVRDVTMATDTEPKVQTEKINIVIDRHTGEYKLFDFYYSNRDGGRINHIIDVGTCKAFSPTKTKF